MAAGEDGRHRRDSPRRRAHSIERAPVERLTGGSLMPPDPHAGVPTASSELYPHGGGDPGGKVSLQVGLSSPRTLFFSVLPLTRADLGLGFLLFSNSHRKNLLSSVPPPRSR